MLWACGLCMACMISGPGGEASVLLWLSDSVLWLLAYAQPNFASMNLDFSLISLYYETKFKLTLKKIESLNLKKK